MDHITDIDKNVSTEAPGSLEPSLHIPPQVQYLSAGIDPSGCACETKAGGDPTAGPASSAPPAAPPAAPPPAPKMVYALGELGLEFSSEAMRDGFMQRSGGVDVASAIAILDYLDANPWHSEAVIWTLVQDATPIYAIRPAGAYAEHGYKMLRTFLRSQLAPGQTNRISIPGISMQQTPLLSGQVLPNLYPDLRGMYSWTTEMLVSASAKTLKSTNDQVAEQVNNFLERIYHEVRNLGATPEERAINFAATEAFQALRVFEAALELKLYLDTISVVPSPICRPGSSCYDVSLTFFDPSKRLERARRVYRFTIDVSAIIPVTVGKVRYWDAY